MQEPGEESQGWSVLQKREAGLLSEIGCFLWKKKRVLVSAGPGSDSDAHSSRTGSKLYQLYSFILFHHPNRETSIGLLQGDLSRNRKACHRRRRRGKVRNDLSWGLRYFCLVGRIHRKHKTVSGANRANSSPSNAITIKHKQSICQSHLHHHHCTHDLKSIGEET